LAGLENFFQASTGIVKEEIEQALKSSAEKL